MFTVFAKTVLRMFLVVAALMVLTGDCKAQSACASASTSSACQSDAALRGRLPHPLLNWFKNHRSRRLDAIDASSACGAASQMSACGAQATSSVTTRVVTTTVDFTAGPPKTITVGGSTYMLLVPVTPANPPIVPK